MTKWKCTVCGYIHQGDEPPDTCPVCGAEKKLFMRFYETGQSAAAEEKADIAEPSVASTKKWRCTVCGYIHQGEEPPDTCPVCGADKSMFELIEEDGQPVTPVAAAAPETPSTSTRAVQAEKWRCTVCGYIHKGPSPPKSCPVCGADKGKFEPVIEEETAAAREERPAAASQKEAEPQATAPSPFPPQLAKIADMLTKFHGHPIAVHIPNGLLPVCVLFTLLAIMFDSASLAVAAKLNTIFVCISMPIVIATGVVDWKNRFGGIVTNYFKVKITCAAIVTLLTLILSIWWIANPSVYARGLSANAFFILLYLADVVAAGVAGWYGGKLVFRN